MFDNGYFEASIFKYNHHSIVLYQNMTGTELKTQASYVASIKKINAELSRDTTRWWMVKADQQAGDFKHAKLVYYQAIIVKK